ncbi:hypothetical protein SAMN05443661_10351 [Natronobacterium gregoryi]|uniref:Uncharacterized protein n=2 Tax=Natronobacterium gregoryi TaxID=44930 RepID=L9Y6D7_NATGS|nr:hypothetical protein C490_07471 [Natronobacterium gregoryi SP2]SFI66390.1 hypothetical protein SAMN05443661_10351 [Natronobacterium gregoryi]
MSGGETPSESRLDIGGYRPEFEKEGEKSHVVDVSVERGQQFRGESPTESAFDLSSRLGGEARESGEKRLEFLVVVP